MTKLRFLRLAVLLTLAAGSVWGLLHLQYRTLFTVLLQAPPLLLLAGAACNFVNLCGKASSWYFLLPRAVRPPYLKLMRYSIASGAFNVVAPLRAGEGLRVYLLQSREGVPASTSVGVAVAEKLLNVLGLVLLVLPVAASAPGLPPWLLGASATCLLAVLGAGAAVLGAGALLPPGRHAKVHAACSVLHGRSAVMLPALMCLLVGWLGDCALAALMLQACDVAVAWWAVPYILFVINVAIVVPSTPAQIGALELAAVGALQLLGVGHAEALAFALLYHAVQIVPLLAVVAAEIKLLREAARQLAA